MTSSTRTWIYKERKEKLFGGLLCKGRDFSLPLLSLTKTTTFMNYIKELKEIERKAETAIVDLFHLKGVSAVIE